MSRTLGQERAQYCLQKLEKLRCDRAEFKPLTAGLPAMILQNGFGQTLAFLISKEKNKEQKEQNGDKHRTAFDIITEWLIKRKLIHQGKPSDILKQISEMEQSKYLQAQKETLAMLEWLKRYANAELLEE
ncbi:MAG: type III-B CRISPR module-associated protein Cmr5 [Deltaproteobacteria bacterium]|nr:type III-B CRISPR module-associated protein Cmr5 [Deltaproteobacteria bacterium]